MTTHPPAHRRILAASLVGTAVEYYDFFIYATAAALVFGELFFPASSKSVQQMSAYATLAIAFFARPLGAAVFGHFGDRLGRKSTLVASLLLMGGSTVAIGFLPTYAQAGWIAPLLLCLLRFGQGIGLGGEWGGATLLAIENAPPGWRARYGMFPQLGSPVGFVAANGLFLVLGVVLTPEQFQAWGWRIPFLLSVVLVGLGLWVRLKITETPAFAEAIKAAPPARAPMGELLRRYPLVALAGTCTVIATFATYYISTAFALGYGVTELGYSRDALLGVQLAAVGFMALGIIAAGFWADAASPRQVLAAGCLLTAVAGFLLAPMMGSGSLFRIWMFLALLQALLGPLCGPLTAFLPSLFPTRVRYTGISLTFNIGSILGGGLAPLIAQTLADRGGLTAVGWYLSAAAVLSFVALLLVGRRPGAGAE